MRKHTDIQLQRMREAAKEMRVDAINATHRTGNVGAHIGGTLSMIEIMAVLYLDVMNLREVGACAPERDRFILSKGHGVLAQYTALKQIGLLNTEELTQFKKKGSHLFAHPSRNLQLGIEFSSGSLGQGVSLAVGVALGLKRNGNPAQVYVLVGDGECDEGSVWEAVASAAHFKLDNLTIIVDQNGLQYDGRTDDVLSMTSLAAKFEAFGCQTLSVNGHDIVALLRAFDAPKYGPKAILAETIKGKGVSFMEHNPLWHNGRLTDPQHQQALAEVLEHD